jgi:hypothetical protein
MGFRNGMMMAFAPFRTTRKTRILATDCADSAEKTMSESDLLHHQLTRKIIDAVVLRGSMLSVRRATIGEPGISRSVSGVMSRDPIA